MWVACVFSPHACHLPPHTIVFSQVISAVHMRIVDGVGTLLQMQSMVARLAGAARAARLPGAGGGFAGGGGGSAAAASAGGASSRPHY